MVSDQRLRLFGMEILLNFFLNSAAPSAIIILGGREFEVRVTMTSGFAGADCFILSFCKQDKKCTINHITHFEELTQTFLGENQTVAHSLPSKYDEESETNKCCFRTEDMWIGDRFAEYHRTHATLRKVCKQCNATRTKFRASAPKRV